MNALKQIGKGILWLPLILAGALIVIVPAAFYAIESGLKAFTKAIREP